MFLFEGPHTDPKSAHAKNPQRIFRHLHCGDFRASPAHLLHPAMLGKRIDICYLDTTYLGKQGCTGQFRSTVLTQPSALDPKYCFPAQDLVISACSDLIVSRVAGDVSALYKTKGKAQAEQAKAIKGWLATKADDDALGVVRVDSGVPAVEERVLVVVGTYSIGKERIVKGTPTLLGHSWGFR